MLSKPISFCSPFSGAIIHKIWICLHFSENSHPILKPIHEPKRSYPSKIALLHILWCYSHCCFVMQCEHKNAHINENNIQKCVGDLLMEICVLDKPACAMGIVLELCTKVLMNFYEKFFFKSQIAAQIWRIVFRTGKGELKSCQIHPPLLRLGTSVSIFMYFIFISKIYQAPFQRATQNISLLSTRILQEKYNLNRPQAMIKFKTRDTITFFNKHCGITQKNISSIYFIQIFHPNPKPQSDYNSFVLLKRFFLEPYYLWNKNRVFCCLEQKITQSRF